MRKMMKPCLLLFVLLAAGALIPVEQSWAYNEWWFTHGNDATLETTAGTSCGARGWGFDCTLGTAMSNWVHFAVPHPWYRSAVGTAPAQYFRARYVRMQYWLGSADVRIKTIHVWNGAGATSFAPFKVIAVPAAAPWTGAGWHDVLVDLGTYYSVTRGLGVSIQIERGIQNLSHRIIFGGVGAGFY